MCNNQRQNRKMETYNLTEQQIKDLASGELKVTDIVKKKITPGWYKIYYEWTDNELFGIFYIYRVSGSRVWYKYGYNYNISRWDSCEDWAHIDHTYIPATDEEVMKMFTEEAKRRYGKNWESVKIKNHADGKDWILGDGDFKKGYYSQTSNFYNVNGVLFSNGEWAEVLEEPLTIEERLERIEKYLKL